MRAFLVSAFLLLPGVSLSDPSTRLVFPVTGSHVSSPFGVRLDPLTNIPRHHGGIDLPAPTGTPVRALMEGTVIYRDTLHSYGSLVVLRHNDGITTHYGHLSAVLVELGELVKAGQILGAVGSTGRATGSHLHLEVRRNGATEDPLSYLPYISQKGVG